MPASGHIQFICPHCERQHVVKSDTVGRQAKCHCGVISTINAALPELNRNDGSGTYALSEPPSTPSLHHLQNDSAEDTTKPDAVAADDSVNKAMSLQREWRSGMVFRQIALVGILFIPFIALDVAVVTQSGFLTILTLAVGGGLMMAISGAACKCLARAKGHSGWWGAAGLAWAFGIIAVSLLADPMGGLRRSGGKPRNHTLEAQMLAQYHELPWYRKSWPLSILLISGIFFGIFLVPVCIATMSGNVCHRPRPGETSFRFWHPLNRIVAWGFLAFWCFGILFSAI